jgi:hypothetical protein
MVNEKIDQFYLGQRNLTVGAVDGVIGAIGAPVQTYAIVLDDNNLTVFTQITVISPTVNVGGIWLAPTIADCTLTHHLFRINGKPWIGYGGIGCPYSVTSYSFKARAILPNATELEIWTACVAPSLVGAGDFILGMFILTTHIFDKKVLEIASEYDILQYVQKMGD